MLLRRCVSPRRASRLLHSTAALNEDRCIQYSIVFVYPYTFACQSLYTSLPPPCAMERSRSPPALRKRNRPGKKRREYLQRCYAQIRGYTLQLLQSQANNDWQVHEELVGEVERQMETWRANTLDVEDIVSSNKSDASCLYEVIDNGKQCLLGILFARK